ncbi:MAG: hypothetical protein WC668_00265 [Patescibacteria group bacterium]
MAANSVLIGASSGERIMTIESCFLATMPANVHDLVFINLNGSLLVECTCAFSNLICRRTPTTAEAEAFKRLCDHSRSFL